MLITNRRKVLSTVIQCSILALPALALAESGENSLMLEEVVVTAQKREESLQDVPIAMQAISGDMLAQNGITNLSDLSSIAPGFKLADTQSTNQVSALRGVNSFAFGFGLEESIPFYLDGVYLGNGFDMLGDLVDIERVEVLKGPQGTIFGRNASGGAISVTSKKPANEFEAEIAMGLGNYGLITKKALVNIPLVDEELMIRAGVSARDRDGWQTNVVTGEDDGFEQDRRSSFLKALWNVSESLNVEYSGDWSHQKDHSGYTSVSTVRPGSAIFGYIWGQASSASFYNEGGDKVASGNEAYQIPLGGGVVSLAPAEATPDIVQKRKISGHSVRVDWDFSEDISLSSISSYRKVESESGSDADGSEFGLVNSYQIGETKEYNQEFRVNASWDSVDWLAGVNYYRQDRDLSVTTYLSSLLTLQRFGAAGLGTALTETSAGENKTESYSFFSDATWTVTDNLRFTAGIRYSYDEKTFTLLDMNNSTFAGQALLYPNYSNLSDPDVHSWDENWSNISGRLGIDYSYSDEVMLYASLSQGYKSGGYNTRLTLEGNAIDGFTSPDFATEPFDEETNVNLETGFKSDLLGGRLRLNSSLFYYLYEDLQVLLADGGSPVARTVNASEVTGYGWDTELIFRATEGLTLSLNVMALSAKYTDDVEDSTGTLRIEEGSERPWAPDWAATFGIDYVVPVSDVGQFRMNLTYSHQDDQFMRSTQVTQSYGDDDNTQEAYGLLNGRLSLYSVDDRWEVALWGKNILNEGYKNSTIAAADSVAGVLTAVSGEPRTYGLEAMYRF